MYYESGVIAGESGAAGLAGVLGLMDMVDGGGQGQALFDDGSTVLFVNTEADTDIDVWNGIVHAKSRL
jgi:hypothetical protein